MRFYSHSRAPSPRRVRIFAAEKGIALPTCEVDLAAGAQFEEAFLAVNPDATVPALVLDDGTCISESIAICRYLELAYPVEPHLFGTTASEQGVIEMWQRRMEQQGFDAVVESFRNTASGFRDRALPGPRAVPQIPALGERGRKRFGGFLIGLDRRLRDHHWVAGPSYSVADITALVAVDFGLRALALEWPGSLQYLARWHATMSARPGSSA